MSTIIKRNNNAIRKLLEKAKEKYENDNEFISDALCSALDNRVYILASYQLFVLSANRDGKDRSLKFLLYRFYAATFDSNVKNLSLYTILSEDNKKDTINSFCVGIFLNDDPLMNIHNNAIDDPAYLNTIENFKMINYDCFDELFELF